MAVAITNTATPIGVATSSSVATYSTVSIGSASADRIVVIGVLSENASGFTISSATIDFGGGDTAMTAGPATTFNQLELSTFYLSVTTGTTATFKITYSGDLDETEQSIVVYRVTGANPTIASSGTDTSTDMDATDPLTTGSVTIASNGGFLGIAIGAANTAKSWTNATEDLDTAVGTTTYRSCAAIRTTAGTVTITCQGITNNEDGIVAWIIWNAAAAGGTVSTLLLLGVGP